MKFLICCGKNYITYTPNDSQYSKWLLLLKKTKPLLNLTSTLTTNKAKVKKPSKTEINLESVPLEIANKKNERLSSLLSSTLNPENDSKSSEEINPKKIEKINPRFLFEQNESSFDLKKDLLEKEEKKNFYKQWMEERQFLQNSTSSTSRFEKITAKEKLKKLTNSFQSSQIELDFNSDSDLNRKNLIENSQKKSGFTKSNTHMENFSKISRLPSSKIGYFPIDALFMPVNRVNYLIESTENLKLPQDRVILEVWTNGSIHPRHAIHKAAKALIQLFLPLQQMRTSVFQFASDNLLDPKKFKDARIIFKDFESSNWAWDEEAKAYLKAHLHNALNSLLNSYELENSKQQAAGG